MKKIYTLSVSCLLVVSLQAQQGKVFDNLSLESKILKTTKKYAIYLPPDYETSQRSYPVLYLLHGGGGNQIVWVQNGNVLNQADDAINSGKATPMIIVMPEASGPKRGYTNDPTGEWLYEDYFFKEFIPYIESTYRIRKGRRYRAIAGLSMGGRGTFLYALRHPEMFSAACPLSAATFPLTLDEAKERLPQRYKNVTEEQIVEYFNNYSIPELMKKIPGDRKNAIRWYIECGDDDALEQVYVGNCLIHIEMRKLEIPHEFRIRDGAHTWELWRSALPTVLEFVTASFHN
ncbi:MAG TPA: esterase family protein [Bacteroidetes bacterium]|nr:esterase family protein [Bacteroidota bacterium]